jgi:hypothetical protein
VWLSQAEGCIRFAVPVDIGGSLPVCLLAIVALAGWWLLRGLAGHLAKATASFLTAVSVGLGSLCAAVFVFNTLQATVDPRWLHDVEQKLIDLYLGLSCFAKPKSWQLAVVVLLVLAVGWMAPRLWLVARLSQARICLGWLFTALTATLTFTFFSPVPLRDRTARAWGEVRAPGEVAIDQLRLQLRREWQAVGEYLAAETLQERLRQLNPEEAANHREFIRRAAQTTATSDVAIQDVAKHLARRQLGLTAEADPVFDELASGKLRLAEEWLAPTPSDRLEWQAGTRLVGALQGAVVDQELAREAAETRAAEATAAAQEVLTEVIAEGATREVTSGMLELTAAFVEMLISESAGTLVREALSAAALSWRSSRPEDLRAAWRHIRPDRLPVWRSLQSLVPAEALETKSVGGVGTRLKEGWIEQQVDRARPREQREVAPPAGLRTNIPRPGRETRLPTRRTDAARLKLRPRPMPHP